LKGNYVLVTSSEDAVLQMLNLNRK